MAGCATGFDSPTRNAVANLQAAYATVNPQLLVQGLIVALPNGSSAEAGSTAYIQFNVTNIAREADELETASASVVAPQPSGDASAEPTPSDVASKILPVGSTKVPAGTDKAPGTARLVVALGDLTQPLHQGESVRVSLQFAKGGSIHDISVPVQGSDVVGSSFLPSAPPSGLNSPSASASS
jgi:hypothetical protein